MNKNREKIRKFTDLVVWQEGHKLVLMIYKITEDFPKQEKYGLTDQMRRAAVSITSNIAEGFSRKSSKEKYQFYNTAKSSITELQNQLLIAKDIKYISKESFNQIAEQSIIIHKCINGLLKATRLKKYET
jgi:four helix bundle protein